MFLFSCVSMLSCIITVCLIHLSHTRLLHIYPHKRISGALSFNSIVFTVLTIYLSPDPFLLSSLSWATVFGKQPLSSNLYFQISQKIRTWIYVSSEIQLADYHSCFTRQMCLIYALKQPFSTGVPQHPRVLSGFVRGAVKMLWKSIKMQIISHLSSNLSHFGLVNGLGPDALRISTPFMLSLCTTSICHRYIFLYITKWYMWSTRGWV